MADIFVSPAEIAAMVPFGIRPVPPAKALNRAATPAGKRQITLAGEGAPVRLIYGRCRVGARLLNVLPKAGSSNVLLQCLWGFGGHGVESVTYNDAALPSGAAATHYDGSQVAADATLVAAFAAQGITYTDTLAGFMYSVIDLRASAFAGGGLAVSAVVKGRKVYDPRDGGQTLGSPATWLWSDNPSLCLADFLASTLYGAGKTLDWTSVDDAAGWNDTALAGGEKHRLLDWTLESVTPIATVVEALRAHAGCWVVDRGGTLRLVQDKATASSATYAHASGQVQSWGRWRKRDTGNSPTVVEVIYTDTTQLPWRDRPARAQRAGVGTTLPRRLSTVRMPGITRYSQAYREATERLNKLALDDLAGGVTVFDAGIAHEAGDVLTVSLPFGISSKPMRLAAPPQSAGAGLWALELAEYDPAAYSTEVQTAPTYADTELDNPAAPPAPVAVSATEEVYQLDNGTYASRARVTITAPSYQWLGGYRIEVRAAGAVIDVGNTAGTDYATPPLREGVTYSIVAYTLSTIGAVSGSFANTSIAIAGKALVPSDVPAITGFEVGGDVYLQWEQATDLDIWRYEIRYGSTGGSWETATFLDRVDGLRAVVRGLVAAGTWKFWVKAVDSVGQYSATATSVTLTVTVDPDALQTEHDFAGDTPTLVNMLAFQRDQRGGAVLWITAPDAAGDKFDTLFSSVLSTYSNVLADYHTSVTSSLTSAGNYLHDFGQPLTGDWSVDAVYSMLSGTATVTLQLSSDGTSWSDHTTLPVKATARYARVKLEATTTETLLVESVRVACAAVTRKEFGQKSCAASGTDTVTLDGEYSAMRRLVLTPIFSGSPAARSAVADAITFGNPTTFAIYLFNDAGTRVAGTVAWAWEGI